MSNMTRRGCTSRAVRARDLVALIALTGATLGAGGCGSSGSTAPQTGSLTVTIAAPTGVTPSVTVSGPGGYTRALSTTTTLTGLAVGSYAVTAAPVTTAAAIVGTVNTGTVTGSPATVAANRTATATATYAVRPGSGGLWVANFGSTQKTVVQYRAGQLGSTTSAAPATAIGTGASNLGVAFDANGNLWVTLAATNAVVEYTASQLSASGTPTPAVTLSATTGSLNFPAGLAFDASGNLWVANENNSSVVEFTVSQLASSGSPTPAVTLSASSGSVSRPFGLAFDASGNLWVASGSNTVVEFAPSQLAASGSPTPAVTLSATAGSLNGPGGLAFDASGNLWVANINDTTVVEFTVSQLTASGNPTPAVTLSATAGSLISPSGLAFDASGNLWVSSRDTTSVVEFTTSQLVVSGSPTPNVTVRGSALDLPLGLAFDPHAANLPLKP